MAWDLDEALTYYRAQGVPGSQSALIALLREAQRENGGGIPAWVLAGTAEACQVKESYLLAVIKRIPDLRVENTHCLELCGGPGCRKGAALAAFVEKTYGPRPEGFTVRCSGCMRMCGKGPNLRWDGTVYHQADEALIRRLIEDIT